MGIITRFLENSSFSGLPNIINSKSTIERGYWVAVSFLMISGAVYLTGETFVEWSKYPIATTTETFPISEVQFPKIVVCPPKVVFSFTVSPLKEGKGVGIPCKNMFTLKFGLVYSSQENNSSPTGNLIM